MKKITLLFLLILAFSWQGFSQFGCANGIVVSDGYTATGITTPGTGGSEDWNSPNPTNTCSGVSGSYWDDDVYLFTYTNNSGASEDITMEIFTRNAWTGLGIFSTCTGTDLNDCINSVKTTSSNVTLTVSTTINDAQTVYIAVGQYGTPNDLDFDVTSFSVVPTPACQIPSGMATANMTSSAVDLSWTAGATGETMWEIVYDVDPYAMPANGMVDATAEPGYNHVSTTPVLSLSGLMANTAYQVYYRAHCGGTDYSDWVGFTFTTPPPPPANDDCANAVSITVNTDATCTNVVSGTIAGATDSGVSDNGTGTPNDDVWFSFVATADTHVIKMLNKAGSYTNLVHEVLSGDCSTLTSINVSDPDTSTVTGLTIGDTYYLRVFGWSSTAGRDTTFDVCVTTPPPPPANDLAVNAIAVTCGDTVTGSTSNATVDLQGDCGSVDNDAPNVFYTFTGSGSAEDVTLSLCNSGYDTSIAVFTGTPGALVCYANNDDSCGLQSEVTFTSDGTQTYYIMIEGYSASSVGNYEMVVSCAAACTPAVANQDCANAMALTLDSAAMSSDNTCATTNVNNPSCDSFGTIADVWFSVVVSNSGELNVTTTLGTATDVNVAVYSGACGSLTEEGCADAAGTANVLNLTGLVPGDTYYIQAWNAGAGEEGTFDIQATGTVVAVKDLQTVGFTYFPNPVTADLTMKANENIQSISIFNMLGQEVKMVKPAALETSINMSDLSAGTYFVKAQVGDAVGTFKVIKN